MVVFAEVHVPEVLNVGEPSVLSTIISARAGAGASATDNAAHATSALAAQLITELIGNRLFSAGMY